MNFIWLLLKRYCYLRLAWCQAMLPDATLFLETLEQPAHLVVADVLSPGGDCLPPACAGTPEAA
ncbi:MAG TPA: hypothetical protein PK640_16570 [Verrucomicrobiota bacterium]|nr:hypothetical protein [Verrucomicrobiota bacterium]